MIDQVLLAGAVPSIRSSESTLIQKETGDFV